MSDFTIGYDAHYACFVETSDVERAKKIATQLEAGLDGASVTFTEIATDGYQYDKPYACFRIDFEGELDVEVDGKYIPASYDSPEETPDFYYNEGEIQEALDKEIKSALEAIELPSCFECDEFSVDDEDIYDKYVNYEADCKAEYEESCYDPYEDR